MHLRGLGHRRTFLAETVKTLADHLQQADRTYVWWRGRRLTYFGGCDYFRMSSHPAVLEAVRTGLDRFGLNAAASRKTTGNHAIYQELEKALADFFKVESAVLFSTGYFTNLGVVQSFEGDYTHVLADERAHLSLLDGARLLRCPIQFFPHRSASRAAAAARRWGRSARILLMTDGLYSHTSEVAPLNELLRCLPKNVTLLVDDAHGAGTLGPTGGGTLEFLGVRSPRIIRTITLSKAVGAYGGAVLGTRKICQQILARSHIFTGNTPLPFPLAHAALAALDVHRRDAGPRLRLAFNIRYVKSALIEGGLPVPDGPGPTVPILPRNAAHAASLRRRLLAADIHPPFIHYPGNDSGYFRFALSSEHSRAQLDALIAVLRS